MEPLQRSCLQVDEVAMSRVLACLTRAAPWGLATLAAIVGGVVAAWFGYFAIYFWSQADPPSVLFGLLWFCVAISVPIAAEAARRYAQRRGESGGTLVTRMSTTTLVAAWCACALAAALWFAGAFLSS
jgi:hypothetical protein